MSPLQKMKAGFILYFDLLQYSSHFVKTNSSGLRRINLDSTLNACSRGLMKGLGWFRVLLELINNEFNKYINIEGYDEIVLMFHFMTYLF